MKRAEAVVEFIKETINEDSKPEKVSKRMACVSSETSKQIWEGKTPQYGKCITIFDSAVEVLNKRLQQKSHSNEKP